MAFATNNVLSGGLNGEGTRAAESFASEVWGPAVEVAMKENLVLTNLCQDLSPFVATQGEKIHLPKVDSVTKGTKGEGPITWVVDGTDAGEETLNVSTHEYAAVLIEDVIKIQGNYDMMNLFAKELGYSLAHSVDAAIDTAISASFEAAGGAINGINVSGSPMGVEADWDLVLTSCLAQDTNPQNWTVVLAPATFANLANISDLALGIVGSPLGAGFGTTGRVSTVYGMNVMMSQNVSIASKDFDTTGTAALVPHGYVVHKSACHIAFSQRARMQSQYDVDYLGTKVIADTIYGTLVRNSSTTGQQRAFLLH